jgi:predicted lipoprotein with Yx(FWY)xxD motif
MAGRRRDRAMCLAAALVASAVTAAGCGGPAGGGAPKYELLARTISGLGPVVTDGQGFTLYMYAPDHRGVSRCYGVCASEWPPLESGRRCLARCAGTTASCK